MLRGGYLRGYGRVAALAWPAHVAERLADYKKPRGIVFVPDLQRSPSGKADLQWAQAVAAAGQEAR